MNRHRWVSVLVLWLGLAVPASAADDPPAPVPSRPPAPAAAASPEQRFNEGLALAKKKDWKNAETAYRDALRGKPAFAEAWNGLGYVLRNQGKYDESVRAYHEALRLKPDYPRAMEYLGEAYVKMGRMDDARQLLDRLKQMKAPEADELARVISGAPTSQRW